MEESMHVRVEAGDILEISVLSSNFKTFLKKKKKF